MSQLFKDIIRNICKLLYVIKIFKIETSNKKNNFLYNSITTVTDQRILLLFQETSI